jgi:hypothetical protein
VVSDINVYLHTVVYCISSQKDDFGLRSLIICLCRWLFCCRVLCICSFSTKELVLIESTLEST